jgi:hypothetical protein
MSDLVQPIEIGKGLVITVESYRTNEAHRKLADRVIEALGFHPDQVVELRISRKTIGVLVLMRWGEDRTPTEQWRSFTIDGKEVDDG